MRTFSLVLLAAAPLCLAPPAALAISAFQGSSAATFGNPSPAVDVTGVGTNTLKFGSTNAPNIITIDGQQFSTTLNAPFSIAAVTITNGTTDAGTTTIPVTLGVNFTTPSGVNLTVPVTVDFTATPNTQSTPSGNADVFLLTSTSNSFSAGGETFSLQIDGFSSNNGGSFSSQLSLLEGQTINPLLFAQVNPTSGPNPPPIPEPLTGTLLALSLGALLIRTSRAWTT